MIPPKKPDIEKKGGIVEYPYKSGFKMTQEMKDVYNWDGAILVKNLLDKEEVALLLARLTANNDITGKAWDLADGDGRASRLVIWNQPGNDMTGMVARNEKIVNIAEDLLGGEAYHYHTKLMMKEAKTGGKHLWHQDYGYWYKNGLLTPDVLTVFIPLDPCVKANGCLQMIKGTHRCGRIEHSLIHGQTVADQERVDFLKQHMEHVYAELEPGDGLFFHSNVLHTSDRNDSDMRRWAFLVSYNRADNDPVIPHHHAQYTPLLKTPENSIKTCTNKDLSGKDFMDPSCDKTTKAKLVESGFH